MSMVICAKGHQYDEHVFASCPYCGLTLRDIGPKKKEKKHWFSKASGNVTRRISAASAEDDNVTRRMNSAMLATDDEITHGYSSPTRQQASPVVGWLVCMEGPEKGRDYRIHAAHNRIGRLPQMDIVLRDDSLVQRNLHAEIIYDPKSVTFSVLDEEGRLSLNGEPVHGCKSLQDGDKLSLGESEFIFVQFCREGRVW